MYVRCSRTPCLTAERRKSQTHLMNLTSKSADSLSVCVDVIIDIACNSQSSIRRRVTEAFLELDHKMDETSVSTVPCPIYMYCLQRQPPLLDYCLSPHCSRSGRSVYYATLHRDELGASSYILQFLKTPSPVDRSPQLPNHIINPLRRRRPIRIANAEDTDGWGLSFQHIAVIFDQIRDANTMRST